MAQDSPLYQETYRPQYHYSPPCGWMNDPNGMVYSNGEYHLFYQFSPQVSKGRIGWGHAVSPDLVHWQTLSTALDPDDIGDIWSGSAVVDADNTSGLVPGGGLVAIFSYQNQSQGIASSSDNGRTWTKYAGNPVIPAMARDFRDPKVFWDAPRNRWVLILAAGHEAQIYTSPNLIEWTLRSRFSEGQTLPIWEVPDLFPLQIDGQTKWVMLISLSDLSPAGGNGIQYFIGDFDGETFTNDNPSGTILWLDYGTDNYAGTTWDNAPDNRRIYIGWMSNWQDGASIPTSVWRGATTLPREFKLVSTPDGIRLAQNPVAELAQLRTPLGTWDNVAVSGDQPLDVQGRTLEIIADFEAGTAQRFGIDVHRGANSKARIIYNTAMKQLLVSRADAEMPIAGFTPVSGAPLQLDNGHLRLHIYVDESSVETFAQDGLVTLSGLTFGDPSADGVAIFADKGDAKLVHMEIYSLARVWSDAETVPEGIVCG